MGKRKAKTRSNPRYERFAREYMVDLNATKAAMRAGYSEKTAHVQGPRLLQIAEVQKLISELQSENRSQNLDLRSRIESELELIAFADIGDVLTVANDGKVVVRDLTKMTSEVRRTIESITQVTTEKSVSRRRVKYGAEGSGDEDDPDYKTTTVESIRLGVKQHGKLTAIQMLIDLHGLAPPKKIDATFNEPAKQRLAARLQSLSAKRAAG